MLYRSQDQDVNKFKYLLYDVIADIHLSSVFNSPVDHLDLLSQTCIRTLNFVESKGNTSLY